jgi:hypothetical protein
VGVDAEREQQRADVPPEGEDANAVDERDDRARSRVGARVAGPTLADGERHANLDASGEAHGQRVADPHEGGGDANARERIGAQARHQLGVYESKQDLSGHGRDERPSVLEQLDVDRALVGLRRAAFAACRCPKVTYG